MAGNFTLPPMGFGPGSHQPQDEGSLEYMSMPQDMRTFTLHVPEIEDTSHLAPALDLVAALADAAEGEGGMFDLSGLDPANRRLIAETLGEGEVSLKMHGIPAVAAQESVFAGVWMLSGSGIDRIEVAPVPALARERAFDVLKAARGREAPMGPGVVNAPALLAELADKSATHRPGDAPHVINLTLLPHTEEDLLWLDAALGRGAVTILSRGYGNCRITATALRNVWRVQFFNSMDTLILDTFEVTDMPGVVLAAPDDLADSAERLRDVMEAIR